jgi:hypothetical protein
MSDRTARSSYSPLLSQRQGAKSFSQGFWPCHSTDRASGTFSAITASGATRTVKTKKHQKLGWKPTHQPLDPKDGEFGRW